MRTKNLLLNLIVWCTFLSKATFAQVSDLDNASTDPNDYLGWDNTTTFPLQIRHNRTDQPIGMYTGGILRLRINPAVWNVNLNGFLTQNKAGYVGISPDNNFFNGIGPFSLLHLAGTSGTSTETYRSWMNVGLTITGNGDGMYLGQRPIQQDITETVLAWGDNATGQNSFGPEHMVFRFVRQYVQGSQNDLHFSSLTGLQIARLIGSDGGRMGVGSEFNTSATTIPQRKLHVHDSNTSNPNGAQLRLSFELTEQFADFRVTPLGDLCIHPTSEESSRNVGIGMADYTPTEKLDVDGTARLRKMPNMTPDALITGKRFDPQTEEDLILNYLNFSGSNTEVLAGDATWIDISNLGNCDWNIVNGGQDVAMGYGAGACVPGNVGIGILPDPATRLDVFKSQPLSTTLERGINLSFTGGSSLNVGFFGNIVGQNNALTTLGIRTTVSGGEELYSGWFSSTGNNDGSNFSVGAVGEAINFGSENYTFGLYGKATNLGCAVNHVIGVYGEAIYDESCSLGVAGYFAGDVVTLGSPYSLSDETTKTNITDMPNGLDIIFSLNPKVYEFTGEAEAAYHTQPGVHFGFLSQEVQEVLPSLVREIPKPVSLNEQGDMISMDGELMVLNYQEIIPILVSAVKELKLQLDVCCASADTKSQELTEHSGSKSLSEAYLFQNTPNPHQGYTAIRYYVPDETKSAEIQFFDMSGQMIKVIPLNQFGFSEVQLNAPDMSDGMYTYGLMVDGKMVDMKKMIKE